MKDDYYSQDLQIPVAHWMKIEYLAVFFMLLYSSYSIYFNLSRERIKGMSRTCAKSCSQYVNFDLDNVLEVSYPDHLLPNPWSLQSR